MLLSECWTWRLLSHLVAYGTTAAYHVRGVAGVRERQFCRRIAPTCLAAVVMDAQKFPAADAAAIPTEQRGGSPRRATAVGNGPQAKRITVQRCVLPYSMACRVFLPAPVAVRRF